MGSEMCIRDRRRSGRSRGLRGRGFFGFMAVPSPHKTCQSSIRSEVRNMNNGKNRQGLAAAAALAFGVLVLAVPEAATRGFAGGTALCLQSVLPALFPFFVVCELLTAAPPPAALLRPMQRVLGLASAETARALLLSWVGGYAVCARLAGQLYGAGRITRRDAALLQVLGCCSGPGFVIGCVGGALLGNVRLGVVLYAAQIGANLGAGAVCQLLSHIVGANIVRPLAVSDGSGLSGKAQPRQLDGRTMFAPTDCTREVSGRSKVLSPTRCGGSLLAEGAKGLPQAVSYTHLRAHETDSYLVCRLLLEKKKRDGLLSRMPSSA